MANHIISKLFPERNDPGAARMVEAFKAAFTVPSVPKKKNQILVTAAKNFELAGLIVPAGTIGRVVSISDDSVMLIDFGLAAAVARIRADSDLIEWGAQ